MRAARIDNGSIEIVEVDRPVPGPGEALVRITSSGVCHSDLHLARGDWFGIPGTGDLGHEGIGVVEELGPGAAQHVAVGDRVILGLGGAGGAYWCGACEYCLGGEPRHCARTRALMGTFAEYIAVYAPALVHLPDAVGDEEVPLACGGLTAYGAVKKLLHHDVVPGSPVAVLGAAGGLGHYAVQLATAFGYQVVGIDLGDDRLEFVESLGAVRAVSPDDARAVVGAEFGGVAASLVFTARLAGFTLGFDLLRKGGLFVAVGIPPTSDGNFELNPMAFFGKGATLVYSAVGNVSDMRELVALAEAGKVRSHVGRTGPLSDLPAIFEELEAGRYLGRAVIDDLTR